MIRSLAMACLVALPVSLGAVPLGTAFTYQGVLKEAGQAATNLYDFQLCLFDAANGGASLVCAPDFDNVPVEDGIFTLAVDFGANAFNGEQRFLELRVRPGANAGAYTALTPRQLVRPTPEALRAAGAPWSGLTGIPAGFADGTDNGITSVTAGNGLTGGTITATGTLAVDTAVIQQRVTGSCAAGQYVRQVNADGSVVCGTDAGGASAGTVTSVATGAGLTGGPITDSGTISIAGGGVGLAQINTAEVQARVAGTCAVGQFVQQINADGTVVCGNDATGIGTVTSVATGVGLTGGPVTNTGTISIADGGVGLTQINTAEVQVRVADTCLAGQYIRQINPDGSVVCGTEGGARINVVDTIPNGGPNNPGIRYTSMAIGWDGLPIISYYDSQTTALKVAKCTDSACTGAATTTIDSVDDVGKYNSIAIGLDGLPIISYHVSGAGDALKFAKCSDAACTTTTINFLQNLADNVGEYGSIAINPAGEPIVSYFNSSMNALSFAKCSNTICNGAHTVTIVDDPANVVGKNTSIAITPVDGFPIISYIDETAGALKVAKCTNNTCTMKNIATIDTLGTGNIGQTSIAIGADGFATISYNDTSLGTLKIAKCTNLTCTINILTTLDDPANSSVGYTSSIVIGADGRPIISYFEMENLTDGALKVARCANASCNNGATITRVDDPLSWAGIDTSIKIGPDGLPIISYVDITLGTLKVTECTRPSCR